MRTNKNINKKVIEFNECTLPNFSFSFCLVWCCLFYYLGVVRLYYLLLERFCSCLLREQFPFYEGQTGVPFSFLPSILSFFLTPSLCLPTPLSFLPTLLFPSSFCHNESTGLFYFSLIIESSERNKVFIFITHDKHHTFIIAAERYD